jgi:hypothetical protein
VFTYVKHEGKWEDALSGFWNALDKYDRELYNTESSMITGCVGLNRASGG